MLARSQGLSRWPATVAAGVFQASPYLLAQTFEGHYPHVWAACWFPWAFWARARQREGQVRGLLAMPLILAMAYLTGHPQEWFLLVTALSVWVGADVLSLLIKGKKGRLAAAATIVIWASALGVGLSLAAIELIPARELLPWVQKNLQQEIMATAPRNYQLHLVNGLQLLSMEALGGPADYLGVDNFWESVLSFGLVPLVLIVVAAVSSSERSRGRGLDHPGRTFGLVCRGPTARALQSAVLGAARAELVSRPGTFAVLIVFGRGDACWVRAGDPARQTE